MRALVRPPIAACQLSVLCGKARSYWARLESGECDNPKSDSFRGVFAATKIDPAWFISGFGKQPTTEGVSAAVAAAKKARGR